MLPQPKSNLERIRRQQKLIPSPIVQQAVNRLDTARRGAMTRDENIAKTIAHNNTSPLGMTLSPQQRIISQESTLFLPVMYATSSLATPPSIGHHQTDPQAASLAAPKIHTDKHDASEIALSIAMAETVNHLIKRCIDERETMPTRIRANALLALQFIRRGLIYQGHILYGSALIPFFTDSSLGENAICIDY